MVEDAIWIDPKRNIALLEEQGINKQKALTLYNVKTRRFEFGKEIPEAIAGDHLYVCSKDNSYVVSYKCQMAATWPEPEEKDKRKAPLYFYKFTKKKIWVLFLMKRAKLNGQSLLDYYKTPYIAQHVAEMIGK